MDRRPPADKPAPAGRDGAAIAARHPDPVFGVRERDPAATASWLAAHLGMPEGPRPAYAPLAVPLDDAPRAVIAEYDLPEPADLPHDLRVGPDGRVVITGMMTHRMYILDPATAEFSTVPIPVPEANPRAPWLPRAPRIGRLRTP